MSTPADLDLREGKEMPKRNHAKRPVALTLAVAGLLVVAGCGSDDGGEATESPGPATVSPVEGSDVSRIELTAESAKRLDVQTAPVQRSGAALVIPYSALFYSPTGETWVYVSPEPLTFVREQIVVEDIDGDRAIVTQGPEPGTQVATVGVAELSGAEAGLGQ